MWSKGCICMENSLGLNLGPSSTQGLPRCYIREFFRSRRQISSMGRICRFPDTVRLLTSFWGLRGVLRCLKLAVGLAEQTRGLWVPGKSFPESLNTITCSLFWASTCIKHWRDIQGNSGEKYHLQQEFSTQMTGRRLTHFEEEIAHEKNVEHPAEFHANSFEITSTTSTRNQRLFEIWPNARHLTSLAPSLSSAFRNPSNGLRGTWVEFYRKYPDKFQRKSA